MNDNEILPCGCGPRAPCPKARKLFELGTPRARGSLALHLAAQLKPSTEEHRILHAWGYASGGVALKRCLRCGIEHTSGKALGIMQKAQQHFWRRNGSAWAPYPPLPQCVSREAMAGKGRAA